MARQLYKAAMGGRLNWILGLFAIAIAGLLFFHFFAASWSNRCDPDNGRLALLQVDGVAGLRAGGGLVTWVNPGPDNRLRCANPNRSVNDIGANIKDIDELAREAMPRNGWTEIAP